jgi:hypothetical protein
MLGGQFEGARQLTCVHCHGVVLVCAHCERGQRYCSESCRDEARRIAQREAGRRYQSSYKGRCAHARRQRRYRARGGQKKVTHQGSQALGVGDVLASELSMAAQATCKVVPAQRCHWCGRTLAGVIGHGFVRHAEFQDALSQWFGGLARGRSP